jgi:hypothetical protein
MMNVPDILFSPTSMLRKQLEKTSWNEIAVGMLDIDQLLTNRSRAHVLVLGDTEAQGIWADIELHARDLPLYPLIVGDGDRIADDASILLRLAPVLKQPTEVALEEMVRTLLRQSAWLQRELISVDPQTKLLVQNSQCEWDRCSLGVVGVVRLSLHTFAPTLARQLELLRSNAYAAIDRIPTIYLSTDDLWSLLLIVIVPWTREELNARESESAILRTFVGDTTGSRKLVMCNDESIRDLLGPVTGIGSTWYPTSDDPLRDRLQAIVKNPEELQALEVLFNKRLSAADFDRIVEVLGKRP